MRDTFCRSLVKYLSLLVRYGALLDSVYSFFPEFTDTWHFFSKFLQLVLDFVNQLTYNLVSIFVSHGEIPTTFRSAGPCLKGSWPWSAPLDLRWGRIGFPAENVFWRLFIFDIFFWREAFQSAKLQRVETLKFWGISGDLSENELLQIKTQTDHKHMKTRTGVRHFLHTACDPPNRRVVLPGIASWRRMPFNTMRWTTAQNPWHDFPLCPAVLWNGSLRVP